MSNKASYFMDMAYSFLSNCLNCFPSSPVLKIKNRTFKILRLLGEGGFSYVYLVQETTTSELYAVKKINCPFGAKSVDQALVEVDAYLQFAPGNKNIIPLLDHCVSPDKSSRSENGIGEGAGGAPQIVYVLLPYYRRGNLQDTINANLVNRERFPERKLLSLMLGVCEALKGLHQFKGRGSNGRKSGIGNMDTEEHLREEECRNFRGAMTSGGHEQVPLMRSEHLKLDVEKAYAHRDIKPGNIMIADNGLTPILMDLGSVAASPISVTSRSIALQIQDTAGEQSTLPYRAPELLDVKTGSVIDTKCDIWSLGCTVYACLVGKNPFEARSEETGGSLNLCILGGDWRFPVEQGDHRISDSVEELVKTCLRVEPSERPDVDELMLMVRRIMKNLPEAVE